MNEKRDEVVDSAMVSIKECFKGRHARGILGNIEQQVKYAYKRGFEHGQVSKCKDCEPDPDELDDIAKTSYAEGWKKGYSDCLDKAISYKDGYHQGLEDAWNAVKYLWHNGTITFDEWNAEEMMDYYKKVRNAKKKDERIKNGNVSALKLYSYIKQEINPYGNPTNETAYEFGNRILDYINDLLENNQ